MLECGTKATHNSSNDIVLASLRHKCGDIIVIVTTAMLSIIIRRYEDMHQFEEQFGSLVTPRSSMYASGHCQYLDTERYILFRATVLASLNSADICSMCRHVQCVLGGKIVMVWDGQTITAKWVDEKNLQFQVPAQTSDPCTPTKRHCTNMSHV